VKLITVIHHEHRAFDLKKKKHSHKSRLYKSTYISLPPMQIFDSGESKFDLKCHFYNRNSLKRLHKILLQYHFNYHIILSRRGSFMVRFEVLTAVSMKIAVFWVVAPCSLVEVYQRFRGPCCLHHLMMEAAIFILTAVRTSNPT
jgi:hypothetical protein